MRGARQRSAARSTQRSARGIALPVVLVIASMMLVSSSAWFEASLLESRNANFMADHLRAFHAADAALSLCTAALASGSMPMPSPSLPGEPQGWRQQRSFEAGAIAPVATWPGAVRPPQCLVEPWHIDSRPDVNAFVVTARGFGAYDDTQSWLQAQVVFDGQQVERHWRRLVARPF